MTQIEVTDISEAATVAKSGWFVDFNNKGRVTGRQMLFADPDPLKDYVGDNILENDDEEQDY